MTTLVLERAEQAAAPLSDWERWEQMSSDELAAEVRYFAAPLLEDPEERGKFYGPLDARPVERLVDYDLPTSSDTLWFEKDETRHPGGAYKLRGAYRNLMIQLADNQNITEVRCASTGNHARGVIEACNWLNKWFGTELNPIIHIPRGISDAKLSPIIAAGAGIMPSGTFEEARQMLEEKKKESALPNSNVAVIEPYDDPRTMAGQASCGYEVVADLVGNLLSREGVDVQHDEITLWVPGGGGGFGAGCAVAFDHFRRLGYIGPNVRIKMAQMENCDALARARRGDEPLAAATLDKSADATALLTGGSLTQKIVGDEQYVADIVSVPKYYVGLAMSILERKHGYGIEPAGALALAASLYYEATDPRRDTDPRRIHIAVTSGANVTDETRKQFASVVSEGRREQFAVQSANHLQRKVSGSEEIFRRASGRTAVHQLLVADGPTTGLARGA